MSTQTHIRRYRDGSIHIEHYLRVGREVRSQHIRVACRSFACNVRRLVLAGLDQLRRPAEALTINVPAE